MNTKNILKWAVLVGFLALLAPVSLAQQSLSSTTLQAAVNSGNIYGTSTNQPTQFIQLPTSITTIIPRQSMLYVDYELMDVIANPSAGLYAVVRGAEGTRATGHISGATVYYTTGAGAGPFLIPTNLSQTSYGFIAYDKQGSCTASNEQILPQINIKTGNRWNCINGLWMVDNGVWQVPPTACQAYASANGTTPSGYGVVGASNTPVVQQAVTATSTNTITYSCIVPIPTGLASLSRQAAVLDVTFLYGVQSNALGTQAVSLSAGTFNSTKVFTSITLPSPAASETGSTVAPVRADSGSITVTPVAASFNTATTTAGSFYSAKFQPGGTANVGLPITTDLTEFLFNVTLQCAATTATQTNSPGLIVHYAYVPDTSAPIGTP